MATITGTPDVKLIAHPRSRRRHNRPPAPPTLPKSSAAHSDPTFLYTPYPGVTPDFDWDQVHNVPSAFNDGYDAHAASPRGSRRDAALNATNAVLSDRDFQFKVFVTDVTTDTELSGSTAQANYVRDFYPHNFVQPKFTVSGVSLDQDDYALLCEFIHQAQHKALTYGNANLTQLWVYGRDSDPQRSHGIDGLRISGRAVTLSQAATLMKSHTRDPDAHGVAQGAYINQLFRGSHLPVLAKGYVSAMPREHERFKYAVAWEFDFIVAAMLDGIYHDGGIVKTNVQKTWVDMLNDAKAQGVVTTSKDLVSFNKAALAYAKANAATMFPNASSNTSNNAGTGGSSAPATGTGAWTTVTATYFTDTTFAGPGMTTGTNGGFLFAELNDGKDATGGLTYPTLGPLFGMNGALPFGFKLEVLNPATGKSAVFEKADIGTGAPGASIDLWQAGSDGIGFTPIGKGPVKIRKA